MPIAVEQLPLRGTNCYLVRASEDAAEAAVIDPGDDAAAIVEALKALGARCSAILVTHCHPDHFGALAELAGRTRAPVWLPELEEPVFRDPAAWFPQFGAAPFTGDATLVAGGETVSVAGIDFDVVPVPGHSPGHVAYGAGGHVFSGDVVFAGGVGRVDLPGGDWDALLESIRRLGDRFGPDAVIWPGHGPRTTIGAELDRNPFLAELRA